MCYLIIEERENKLTDIMIFEHKVSRTGKIRVETDKEFEGRGITKHSNGDHHSRGFKTFYMTKRAFKRVAPEQAEFKSIFS